LSSLKIGQSRSIKWACGMTNKKNWVDYLDIRYNYLDMQDNYLDMQDDYLDMRDDYLDMWIVG
jgi:hypothetical protein